MNFSVIYDLFTSVCEAMIAKERLSMIAKERFSMKAKEKFEEAYVRWGVWSINQ